jgi:site-specific recombinase XerD
VFPGRIDGHLSPGYVGRLVSEVLPDGVVPHQLRHAAASAWHALGLDIAEIRVLLGHASIATTQRYVLTRSETARRTVEAAAARLHPTSRPRPPLRAAGAL